MGRQISLKVDNDLFVGVLVACDEQVAVVAAESDADFIAVTACAQRAPAQREAYIQRQ